MNCWNYRDYQKIEFLELLKLQKIRFLELQIKKLNFG